MRLLASHGYSRADVEAMGKRDRVAIVRSIASSAAAEGLDISKYARDPDASAKGKLTAQQMNAAGAKIWEAQIRALAKTGHPDADAAADELGSDDSDAMADEMEAMLDREAEKGVSAAQDARDLDRMRREQIYDPNGFRREAGAPPPGRTGLTGAVSEMAGLGRRPRQVRTGRQLLKKTEWVTNAQGEYVQRVSYDDDQAAVEKFRRKQIAEKKRTRQVLSIEESAEEKEQARGAPPRGGGPAPAAAARGAGGDRAEAARGAGRAEDGVGPGALLQVRDARPHEELEGVPAVRREGVSGRGRPRDRRGAPDREHRARTTPTATSSSKSTRTSSRRTSTATP